MKLVDEIDVEELLAELTEEAKDLDALFVIGMKADGKAYVQGFGQPQHMYAAIEILKSAIENQQKDFEASQN